MSVLWVPAWDFDRDGWLHSRMAMMRAVELGCPMMRTARGGRITITDSRGRVLSEAITEGNRQASLLAPVAFEAGPTLYQQWGDWFGWVNLIALACLALIALRLNVDAKKRPPHKTV
jgi:apolipoprotein N-acyltransferase